MAINSDAGTINQIPVELKRSGNTNAPTIKNTNVLRKEISAEIFPFENAVNIAEAKIFTPVNTKHIENHLKPSRAIL